MKDEPNRSSVFSIFQVIALDARPNAVFKAFFKKRNLLFKWRRARWDHLGWSRGQDSWSPVLSGQKGSCQDTCSLLSRLWYFLWGEKLAFNLVLWIGKLSHHELRTGKKVVYSARVLSRSHVSLVVKVAFSDSCWGRVAPVVSDLCECCCCRNLGVTSSTAGHRVIWAQHCGQPVATMAGFLQQMWKDCAVCWFPWRCQAGKAWLRCPGSRSPQPWLSSAELWSPGVCSWVEAQVSTGWWRNEV